MLGDIQELLREGEDVNQQDSQGATLVRLWAGRRLNCFPLSCGSTAKTRCEKERKLDFYFLKTWKRKARVLRQIPSKDQAASFHQQECQSFHDVTKLHSLKGCVVETRPHALWSPCWPVRGDMGQRSKAEQSNGSFLDL